MDKLDKFDDSRTLGLSSSCMCLLNGISMNLTTKNGNCVSLACIHPIIKRVKESKHQLALIVIDTATFLDGF